MTHEICDLRRAVRAIGLTLVLYPSIVRSETISGVPDISDADTFAIKGVKIRLAGVDAPEVHPQQICLDAKGANWRCGDSARQALVAFASGKEWQCQLQVKRDRYKRRVGTCSAGGADVQHWLVRTGWAIDYSKYSHGLYQADQEAARVAKRGLWAGAFHAPWNWRHRTCKTTILGAFSVPIDAQDKLCRPPPKHRKKASKLLPR